MVPGVGRRDPARRMASSYRPAHAVAQPVQPSYHLLYHHFAAALTQPTSSVQMIPQPMFQSITTAPSLPMQSVPVPTLPKLMNDSERESTDLKMALAHLLNTHAELSEHYKYRALMEQLILEEACLLRPPHSTIHRCHASVQNVSMKPNRETTDCELG